MKTVNIDVDWMDPDFIKSMPMKPHDQTSNQLWLGIQLGHPSNESALAACAQRMRGEGWLAVYTKMVHLPPSSIHKLSNPLHPFKGYSDVSEEP